MGIETLTLNSKEARLVSKSELQKHEQFCIALFSLIQNGAELEVILPLAEEVCRQSEDLI